MYLNKKKPLSTVILLAVYITTFTGCDRKVEESTQQSASNDTPEQNMDERNLWHVAGQSLVPKDHEKNGYSRVLTQSEKKLVGRYIVTIPCHDPVARCGEKEEGSVDFILNLASDGSVYRLIKSLGMIQLDTRKNVDNDRRYDHWSQIYINNQMYVVTSYATGMHFYYKVLPNNSLMMDLKRTRLINLQEYRQGYPFPIQEYELKKQA